jgi:undecaprenyl-diphosphatase
VFPLGLPVVYIPLAHAAAWWLGTRRVRGANAIAVAAWAAWLAHRTVKLFVQRKRPPGPRRGQRDSFPSGHTTAATALALTATTVLARAGRLSPRRARAIGVAAPAIMGASRVLTDEHWATDVVGGWALGALVAGVVAGLARKD